MRRLVLAVVAVIVAVGAASAEVRYGSRPLVVESLREWKKVHRPVIYDFFEREVYGRQPQRDVTVEYRLLDVDSAACGGVAVRRQVAMHIEGMATPVLLLVYHPREAVGSVPVFLGMNFKGNHNVEADEAIIISPNAPKRLRRDPARGAAVLRWPLRMIIEAGYGVVTFCRADIDPDFDDGFRNGVHPLFYREGQTRPSADEWGTIAAWAWGLSRAMDYIEQDKMLNEKHVAVIGHSRLGKTALWAAATDPRFAIAISNNSGCTGAALSSRCQGETVFEINKRFPHWFCENYKRYSNAEHTLPIDQQGLIALIAPRPVYVASSAEDRWADPEGEFLAALFASPIYELYGRKGLSVKTMPAVHEPAAEGDIAYHVKAGKHGITAYDWEQYIRFADRYFK